MSYRAKVIGTGRYKVFVEVNARARGHGFETREHLRRAVENKEFRILYQPIG